MLGASLPSARLMAREDRVSVVTMAAEKWHAAAVRFRRVGRLAMTFHAEDNIVQGAVSRPKCHPSLAQEHVLIDRVYRICAWDAYGASQRSAKFGMDRHPLSVRRPINSLQKDSLHLLIIELLLHARLTNLINGGLRLMHNLSQVRGTQPGWVEIED
jgi:hypothetical protein